MANNIEETALNTNLGLSRRWLIVIYCFLSIVSVVPIWICQYFPSQNGPEYFLFVHMVREFDNPMFNYSDYYEFLVLVVPNLLFHVLVYLLSYVFPLPVATKIILSFCIVILPASVFYFLKMVDSRKMLLGFAAFPYAYNHFIPKGYNSFYLSIPLFFFFLGYLIKHINRLNTRRLIFLTFLVFLIYLSHMFSFLFAIPVVILYLILRNFSFKRMLTVLAVFVPSLILFAQYVLFILRESHNLVGSGGNLYRYSLFSDTLQHFFTMYMYSYSLTPALLFWIPTSLVIYLIVQRIQREYSLSKFGTFRNAFKAFVREETFLLFVPLLSIIFFALPRDILGWGKFNTRFLPFIFVFLVASAEPFSKKIANWVFIGASGVSCLLIIVVISLHVVKLNKELNDYLSGMQVMKQNPVILPLRLDNHKVGKIRPFHWAFDYYNVVKGGATGKSVVTYIGRVPMKYRRPIEEVFPSFNPERPEDTDIMRIRECYDYILCWGKNQKVFNIFENNGFKLRHEQGKLRIYEPGNS